MTISFSSASTAIIRENLAANSSLYNAVAAFDSGQSGTITYSLSGADSALLTIDADTGVVSVLNGTDYETKASYAFTVTATNGTVSASLDIDIAVENALEGTDSSDTITGGDVDNIIVGGLGDDTIDGGAGYNIYEVDGSADTFVWSVNASGEIILQDFVVDGEGYDASNQGIDNLRNIQAIRYITAEGSIEYELELDDHSNAVASTNQVVNFGERITGRFDFYGDKDYFNIDIPENTKVHLSSQSNNGFDIYSDNESNYLSQFQDNRFFSSNNASDYLYVRTYNISTESPMSSKSYDFTLRRVDEGTDLGEVMNAGDQYEYLSAGVGNDTLNGSDRSDYLLGGSGDDILTGSEGNDILDGGTGNGDVAVFSGNFSDYEFVWSQEYVAGSYGTYLNVIDKINNRDGSDSLTNIEVLRFADGDVSFDPESSESVQIGAGVFTVGESITGTIPITQNDYYSYDIDYFKLSIPLDISTQTALRISISTDSDIYVNNQLNVSFNRYRADTQLQFTEVSSENSISEFNFNHWGNSYSQTWIVKPISWGNDEEFRSTIQAADLILSGRARSNDNNYSGLDLANYTISIDKVLFGNGEGNVIEGQEDIGFIDAQAGNDQITGSVADEEIYGGLGDDQIDGGAGDDIIFDPQGTNNIQGGAGNDTVILAAEYDYSIGMAESESPKGSLDGGTGQDTLIIGASYYYNMLDVTGLTSIQNFENFEVFNKGESAFTIDELIEFGFLSAAATFKLDQNDNDGGTLDLSNLSGSSNLRGTNQSDTLIGNDQDNTIFLWTGNYNENPTGQGSGSDTVKAGAGDDLIHLDMTQYFPSWTQIFTGYHDSTEMYYFNGDYDGGDGNDEYRFTINERWFNPFDGYSYQTSWGIDYTQVNFKNIEVFSILNNYSNGANYIRLTTDQVNQFNVISGKFILQIQGGGQLNLSDLDGFDISGWRIIDDSSYEITGTDNADTVALSLGSSTYSLGAGNDTVIVDGKTTVNDILIGGEGSDTLIIKGTDVDLSNASIDSFENIRVSAQSLSMTQAQWDSFANNIEIITGATTEFVLTLTEAGSTSLDIDSDFVGLTGTSGDDTLIGNALDNILVGSAGDDNLIGNAGDDRLVAGTGTDRLSGGKGDDTFVLDKSISNDDLIGGEGIDTLIIHQDINLSGATLNGVEILKGDGVVTLTQSQLSDVSTLDGINIQLSGDSSKFIIPANLKLINGASISLPNVDSEILNNVGYLGSASDDIIVGSSLDDTIFGGRGSDTISGGDGNDIIDDSSGNNIISSGGGDDKVYTGVNISNRISNQVFSGNVIDGGEGNDILTIELGFEDFSGSLASNNFYEVTGDVARNIEIINFHQGYGFYRSGLLIDANILNELDELNYSLGNNGWHASLKINSSKGEDVDLSNVSGRIGRIFIAGELDELILGDNPNSSYSVTDQDSYITFENIRKLTGSDNDDRLHSSDSSFDANLSGGNDFIQLSSNSIKGNLDGGEGNDTLYLTGYLTDISTADITNFENIIFSEGALIVSQEQDDALNISGNGSKYIKDGDSIKGTSLSDNYYGTILNTFEGAGGDDNVSNIHTFVVSGNFSEYDYTPGSAQITLQHSRGSLADGTDTLNNVLNIQFADTTIELDDAPNSSYNYLENNYGMMEGSIESEALRNALIEIDYDKQVSFRKNYSDDQDVFLANLVPNSPLYIEGSTPNGNTIYFQMTDVESGQQLRFRSLKYDWTNSSISTNNTAEQKWLPEIYDNTQNKWVPYQGGEVVVQSSVSGDAPEDYVFTFKYLDDYAGSDDTLGVMDAQLGQIQGYIGDIKDHDWIRTELIAGTRYEFNLQGVSSDGGTLVDPKLVLRDSAGRAIEQGLDIDTSSTGTDDKIIFRPTETATYYLDVSDVAELNNGSWTLTQASLDTVAGNTTTTERVEWTSGNTFKIESEINALSDHDWFKVWLDKGVTYQFSMDGTSLGGTLQDPQLSVRSITGRLLTQDDNSGSGADAKVIFSATDSGWYYLDAGASGNAYKGTYIIQGSSIADDYSDTLLTEGVVSVAADEPTSGLITFINDKDWFKAGLSAGVTYVISVKGDMSADAQLDPLTDPILFIRDENGDIILRSDDSDGLNVQAYFTPTSDGLYFFDIGSAFKYDIGAYQIDLSLAPPDDHASVLDDTATAIELSGTNTVTTSGNIGIPGDKDVFKVTFEEGKVYLIEGKGFASNAGTLIDPYIRVFNEDGFLIDFNNNGGKGNDAKFYFVPESDGTFYVELSANNNVNRGTFNLSISERNIPADDVPNNITTGVELDAGESFAGNILTQGDEDWFRIKLEANESYVFKLKALASGFGSLFDPLIEIRDASGQLIKSVDDMLISNEPSMAFTPIDNGNYYIVVKSSEEQDTGTYTLITRAPDDHGNTQQTSTTIELNDVLTGGIQYNEGSFGVRAIDSVGRATDSDKDWFSFSVVQGEVYSFSAQLADGSLLSRPMVEIIDEQGRIIAIGDGLETDNGLAVASFNAHSSGTFYARVIDGAGSIGDYKVNLSLGDASDEDTNGPVELSFVNDGTNTQSEVIGNIALAGDTDTYEIALQEGHEYRIETVAIRDGNIAPLPNAQLNMSFVPSASESKISAISQTVTKNADGTFTIDFYVAETVQDNWEEGIDSFTLSLAYSETLLGTLDTDNVTFAQTALGIVQSDIGQLSISGTFTESSYSVSAEEPIFSITTSLTPEELPVDSLIANELSFNQQQVEVTPVVGAPSAFEEGYIAASSDGTLTIELSPLETTQTGQYQIRVIDLGLEAPDDYVDSVDSFDDENDAILAINESARGKIGSEDDKDIFAVNLSSGNIYDFSVKSFYDGLGSLAQAELRLLDENGNLVSVGNIDDVTGRADMSISVFTDGRYFLEVSGTAIPGNIGTYTLDTRLRSTDNNTEDDYSADTQSSAIVGPGKPLSGELEVAGDRDWARVTLEAGNVYVIDVLADGDGAGGNLSDSTLRVLNAEGSVIAQDDNSGAGLDSHIQFTPSVSGEYYLDVGARGDATGTYTLRVRELYSGIADPLASSQWYLEQTNVTELGGLYSGAGITVGVVDDGIDTSHPDLQENLDFSAAFDTQFDTQDGNTKYPYLIGSPDNHGTNVAGIIGAVANNETGIVGTAFDAEIASTRVKWAWGHITQALGLQWQFDISNNSWGAIAPFSDNFNSTAHTFDWFNIRKGVEQGRDGKGTVFVFSAGNSAGEGDNTNYHNFQNAREVITVGSVSSSDQASGFSTPGASVLVAAYGENLITTDRHQEGWGNNPGSDYDYFTGTSASAPLVSGIVALMLEANPNLGYRDIQKILAYSARHPDVQSWKENSASDLNLGGLSFNDKSGFGIVDAYAAVQIARTWQEQNTAINEVSASDRQFGMLEQIPDGDGTSFTLGFEIDSPLMVEHVELGIDLRHQRLGDLIITLTSPNGTVSTLMNRPTVNDEAPFGVSGQDSGVPTHLLWDFSSVQFWGEEATGTWTITVTDTRAEQTGSIQSLSLRVYGERDDGNDTYVFTDEGFQSDTSKILEDDGGKDTINAAAVRFDAYIDLFDGVIAANTVTYGIADWSIIENAISGKGSDRLVGNSTDNMLDAGAGNDVLEGGVGDDTLIGGSGSDTAVYSGPADGYSVSWDASTETITVTDIKMADGDEGTDSLIGIERIVFSDSDISLSEQVGNNAPVANRSFFEQTIVVATSAGIDLQIPADAFSDEDESEVAQLSLAVSDAAGGELPSWLSYDEDTGTFTGVPPEDYQGSLKIKVEATDEFGETANDILTLQFGPDQGPILDDPSELTILEDAELTPLGFTIPIDPEGTAVTVKILEIPSFGAILDKTGAQVAVGSTYTADEFSELNFKTEQNANGDAGYIRYSASDENGVTAQSSLHVFVDAVNDAPVFTTTDSKLVINYPAQSQVTLDLQTPSDPESDINMVTVIALPELGLVSLDGEDVVLNQVLTIDQLSRLSFTIAENVNGPIGGVTIQAVDSEGLATNWTLNLEVSGDAESSTGTSGNDELYGSILADTIYGQAGDDLLVGNAGDDRLLAGLGNDTLLGGSGADKLDGSAGNDYIDGGADGDLMAGGPGNDTYIVQQLDDVVLEVIAGGAGGEDIIVTSLSLTAPKNVENLFANEDNVINLTGNELDNILSGNEQVNTLTGGAGRDTLLGNGGNDILDGGSNIDRMVGGLGSDTYYVDNKADRIVELAEQGVDHVYAASSYTLSSNLENLTLTGADNLTAGGNSLDNHLIGNSGNNILAGGLGADTLEGGLGDDIYVLSDNLDIIIDTGGNDTIRSSQDLQLQAGIENAQLVGIADTYVVGNGLDNYIQGNLGNNILDGGLGIDELMGGEGADQFIIASNGEDIKQDTVLDFTSGDDLLVIDLSSFGIDVVALGINSSGLVSQDSFVFGAGAVALDANDHFIYDTAQGILYFDEDGNGDKAAIELTQVKMEDSSDSLDSSDIFVGI